MIFFGCLPPWSKQKKYYALLNFSSFCFLADVVECGQHRDQVSIRKAPHWPGNVLHRFDTSQTRQRVVAAFCRGHHLQRATYPEKFSQGQDFVEAMGPISSNWFDFCALECIDKI